MRPRLDDDAGMVGKIIIIWLLMVAVLGIVAMDTASIMFAKFRASDVAAAAAAAGAATYRVGDDVSDACDAARASAEDDDASVHLPKSFCKVDGATGRVTIVVRKNATTIVAGRLSFTEDLTKVVGKETAGPSSF